MNAALVGLGAQVVLVAASFLLSAQQLAPDLSVIGFVVLGLLVWGATLIAAILRKARAAEAFELEAASRDGDAAKTIFESEIDARPAGRRLEKFLRLGVPGTGLIVGLSAAVLGFTGLRSTLAKDFTGVTLPDAALLAGLAGGAAFAGFVAGFYLLGTSTLNNRPLIRGAAVYLLGGVLLFALVAATGAAKASLDIDWLVAPIAYAIPAITLLVGLEILLNLILELYRPVAAGETLDDRRPAFNARVIEFVVSPGGVARQLNEAFRYQFGFEVTQSWFAGVLKRSAAGLLLVGVGLLVLLSTIVVVRPQQVAVTTTFGRLGAEPLGPGIHFKPPWPIGRAFVEDIARTNRLTVGTHTDDFNHPSFLWETQHTGDRDLFLLGATSEVQTNQNEAQGATRAPVASLAAADVTVHWRIDEENLEEYITGYADPIYRLEVMARQALARELAQYDVDEAIGARRVDIAAAIEERLLAAVEAEPLGIEILSVGLNSVRPPQSIAAAFNETVASEQDKLRLTEEGRVQAEAILSRTAGTPDDARRIATMLNELPSSGSDLGEREAQVSVAIRGAGGTAADELVIARGGRYEVEASARGRTARATALADAFSQAREMVSRRLRLRTLAEAYAERPKEFFLTDSSIHLMFEGEQNLGLAGLRGTPSGDAN
ncbi:MAG: SPFH domain-containing protein [Planctomycetota bacterium]